MTPVEFVKWLKEKGLFSTVESHHHIFERIYRQCLAVQREHVLIIGDAGYERRRASALMLGCYLLAAKRLGLKYQLVIQEPKALHATADDSLVQSLLDIPDRSVLVVAISGKLGSLKVLGKSFRKYVRNHNHRFASTMSIGDLPTHKYPMLMKSLDIDYDELCRKGRALKAIMDRAAEIRVTAPGGTDLRFDVRRMAAVPNTGRYTEPRSGGNIPAGEVYIAPRKRGVWGRAVIDVSSKVKGSTTMIRKPIRMRIEEGKVTELKGGEEAELLKDTLRQAERRAKYPWGIRRIGELGIGLNSKASIAGPTLINEKVLGTAHIALGSNVWFGGSIFAITHYDQVFKDATVYADKRRIDIRNI
jgi:hypothetical protein